VTVHRWAEANREILREVLPEALVLLPLGATEQHGPHLATGTDALLATESCVRAAEAVADECPRPLVIAPTLPFGASDHHLAFGGTLSLTPSTLLSVLGDLARSVVVQGGRRLVLVNGHGGNIGVCRSVAEITSAHHDIAVAAVNYWPFADPAGVRAPGHAGEFETSVVLAIDPTLVGETEPRDAEPPLPELADVEIHTAKLWQDINGYTDLPARADARRGRTWLTQIVSGLGAAIVELARML